MALTLSDGIRQATEAATGMAGGLPAALAPDGRRGRVLRWASRLPAAGLVACGVLLAIEGVLAV